MVVMELKGFPSISSGGCGMVPTCLHAPALHSRGGMPGGPHTAPHSSTGGSQGCHVGKAERAQTSHRSHSKSVHDVL